MRRWDSLVERCLEEYEARGVTAGTVEVVRRDLDRWGQWLKHRRPRPALDQVGTDLIVSYLRQRSAFRAKATVRQSISAMRLLGEFLTRQGIWSSNPLRWLRGPKLRPDDRLPRRLSSAVLQSLLEGAATGRQGYHRFLWLAILAVLYGTGIRRGELERLDLGDWQAAEGLLQIDGRKTGRVRRVPVPPLTQRCLEAYVLQRHNHLEQLGCVEEPALFVNKWGGRIRGVSVSKGIQTLARRCGQTQVTLHQFRHTCASDLLEGGVRLPEVQRMLGHQSITTTVRYLHIADPQRREAVRRHPLNEILALGGVA